MAKQTITRLIDDIDGTHADETVEFGLDGVAFTIDLTTAHAKELRDIMGPYAQAGSKVSRNGRAFTRTTVSNRENREHNAAVRAWAKQQGLEVSERGRIPSQVVEAFEAAHQG